MKSAPGLATVNALFTPASTSRTSGESGSIVAMTSASRTASATLSVPRTPAEANRCVFAGVRLKPMTSNPEAARCVAIGAPMMPRPMNATPVIDLS